MREKVFSFVKMDQQPLLKFLLLVTILFEGKPPYRQKNQFHKSTLEFGELLLRRKIQFPSSFWGILPD
jgi:hypothetical protein